MAGGHVGSHGDADGVTQPGGTPGSTVRGRPDREPHERDVIGVAGTPGERGPDEPAGGPVDDAEAAARARQPGQQLSAGEG